MIKMLSLGSCLSNYAPEEEHGGGRREAGSGVMMAVEGEAEMHLNSYSLT